MTLEEANIKFKNACLQYQKTWLEEDLLKFRKAGAIYYALRDKTKEKQGTDRLSSVKIQAVKKRKALVPPKLSPALSTTVRVEYSPTPQAAPFEKLSEVTPEVPLPRKHAKDIAAHEKDAQTLKFIQDNPFSTYGIIRVAMGQKPDQMRHTLYRLLKAEKIYKTDTKTYAVIDPPAGQRQQKEEEK